MELLGPGLVSKVSEAEEAPPPAETEDSNVDAVEPVTVDDEENSDSDEFEAADQTYDLPWSVRALNLSRPILGVGVQVVKSSSTAKNTTKRAKRNNRLEHVEISRSQRQPKRSEKTENHRMRGEIGTSTTTSTQRPATEQEQILDFANKNKPLRLLKVEFKSI